MPYISNATAGRIFFENEKGCHSAGSTSRLPSEIAHFGLHVEHVDHVETANLLLIFLFVFLFFFFISSFISSIVVSMSSRSMSAISGVRFSSGLEMSVIPKLRLRVCRYLIEERWTV